MTSQELFALLDRTCTVGGSLKDDDAEGYGQLTSLVQQLALCIDDGTIPENTPGYQTAIYLVNQLVEANFIEF